MDADHPRHDDQQERTEYQQSTPRSHLHRGTRRATLSDIADDAYGTPERWPTIAKANPDVIDDPDLINVGDRLGWPAVTKKPITTSSDRAHSEAGDTTRDSTTNNSPTEKSTDQDAGKHVPERDAADHERVDESAPPAQQAPASTTPPQETAGRTPTRSNPAQSNPAGEATVAPVEAPHSAAFSDARLWAGAASALLAAGVVGLLALSVAAPSRSPGGPDGGSSP